MVRPTGETFTIIAGERRWRAAREAGWTAIASIVRDVDEAAAFELSMIENVVRADMNAIEEAAGYQKLVDGGMTVETIAARLGKTAQDVRFRVALLKLDAPIRDLVAAGQLGTWDAWHIARLTIEGQHRVIRAMRNGELKTTGAVHRFALAVYEQEAAVPMFGEAEVEVLPAARVAATRDLVTELSKTLAALERADALVGQAEVSDEATALLAAIRVRTTKLAAKVATTSARTLARQERIA